jgi:hypothetical protein
MALLFVVFALFFGVGFTAFGVGSDASSGPTRVTPAHVKRVERDRCTGAYAKRPRHRALPPGSAPQQLPGRSP